MCSSLNTGCILDDIVGRAASTHSVTRSIGKLPVPTPEPAASVGCFSASESGDTEYVKASTTTLPTAHNEITAHWDPSIRYISIRSFRNIDSRASLTYERPSVARQGNPSLRSGVSLLLPPRFFKLLGTILVEETFGAIAGMVRNEVQRIVRRRRVNAGPLQAQENDTL